MANEKVFILSRLISLISVIQLSSPVHLLPTVDTYPENQIDEFCREILPISMSHEAGNPLKTLYVKKYTFV